MLPKQVLTEDDLREMVLDHGFVRLVSYTQPATAQRSMWAGDLEVVRNARVSFDADWRTGEDEGKDEKLIGYMLKNHHTSPFEAMTFTFEVKCPIFVARQWHRHRTWSYNELSARYAELQDEFYVPEPGYVGTQSKSNKQVRDLEEAAGISEEASAFVDELQAHSALGFRLYRKHLEAGIPRELARCFLGLNTYTRYFATVDLHNLMHFLRLRLHPHAQWEIRQYAEALLRSVFPVCPVAMKYFTESLS